MVVRYLLLVLLISGCASSIKQKDIVPLTNLTPQYSVSPEEKKIIQKADNLHAELLSKGLIYKEVESNKYINEIAEKISPVVNSHIDIKFFIIKDSSVNAFALPNGNIYINLGLISRLDNEHELAFVIAHELAHVIERHGLKKYVDRKNTIVGSHVADLLFMGTGLVYYATMAELSSFSKKMEYEADSMALNYVSQSDYSSPLSIKAINKLKNELNKREEISFWGSHPDIEKRISRLEQETTQLDSEHSESVIEVSDHDHVKNKVRNLVINLRLRNKQFLLAESFIDEELSTFPQNEWLLYYKAEVNRQKASDIKALVREYAWLNDMTVSDKLTSQLSEQIPSFIEQAESHYTKANEIAPNLNIVFKGKGLLSFHQKQFELAKNYLEKYLASGDMPDERYIKSIISNIK